jgi:hypothetical protein
MNAALRLSAFIRGLNKNLQAAGTFEGLGATVNVELLIDVAHVALDCAGGEKELIGDLLIRKPAPYVL